MEYNITLVFPGGEKRKLIWFCVPRVNEQVEIGKLYAVANVRHVMEKSKGVEILVYLINAF